MSSLLICPHCHHWEPARDKPADDKDSRCRVCGTLYDREHMDSPSFVETDPTQNIRADEEAPNPLSLTLDGGGPREVAVNIDPAPPELPGYVLLRQVGRGGMGVVYEARQINLNRVVAVKMLLGGRFAEADNVARFHLEAEAVARLQHPNIVQIFDVGTHNGQPFFAMEFVDGGCLAQKLAVTPPPAEAARIVAVLARAVHHAHEEGIIHRDLKPGNVLLTRDGQLKITDFGLARRLDLPAGVTATGTFVGTPEYMAPEQARGRAIIGPGVDIYALGVLLYEMLAGEPPFTGPSVWETLGRVCEQEPVPPGRLKARVPRDLETVCLKCLQKDPHRRYPSARELADDLDRFGRGEPVRARPIGALERTWRFARRRPALTALIATVVAVFVVGLPVVTLLWLQASRARAAEVVARTLAQEEMREADRLRAEAEQRGAHLAVERGLALCEQGEVATGLLWLLHSLRLAERFGDEPMARAIRINLAEWKTQLALPTARLAHSNSVQSAAFTPDGATLLTGSNLALRWDPASGKLRGPPLTNFLPEDITRCWSVAVSPDGKLGLTGRSSGIARFWDLETGKQVGKALEHPRSKDVWTVAFSPDGRLAATGAGDNQARLWAVPQGEQLGILPHPQPVSALAFNPDGKLLLTGCWDGVARLWEVPAGKPSRMRPLAHADRVLGIAFSPDPTSGLVCTACRDGNAQMWDIRTGERVGESLRHLDEVTSVAFSPDGGLVMTGSRDDTARLWDVHTGRPVGLPLPHENDVLTAVFAPDGKTAVVGGEDRTCRIWSLPRSASNGPPLTGHRLAVDCLGFSRDGRRFLSSSRNTVLLWEADTGRRTAVLAHPGPLRQVALHPDGQTAAVAFWRADINFWDVGTDGVEQVRQAASPAPLAGGAQLLAYTPDGTQLLAVPINNPEEVRTWSVPAERWLDRVLRHPSALVGLSISADGKRLAGACADRSVHLWDLASGERVGRTLSHSYRLTAVAVSPDGRNVATGCRDGTLRVWDVMDGETPGSVLAHPGGVLAVGFSPDGTRLVSGGADQTVRVWDAITGTPIGPMLWHRDAVQVVGFTPDGRTVVTGSRDRTARRWRVPLASAEGTVEELRQELERLTGLTLDDSGTITRRDATP